MSLDTHATLRGPLHLNLVVVTSWRPHLGYDGAAAWVDASKYPAMQGDVSRKQERTVLGVCFVAAESSCCYSAMTHTNWKQHGQRLARSHASACAGAGPSCASLLEYHNYLMIGLQHVMILLE